MAEPVKHERRAAPRVATSPGDGLDRARLRPGRVALVVDLSAGGALIETDCRLMPGARVELQLGDPKPVITVGARIVRCHVSLLDRERIRYRGALAFEKRLPWVVQGNTGKPLPVEKGD